MKKRVAFLSRVSTMDQHKSVDNQKEIFNNWLEKNKNNCEYFKTYNDEGISGAKGYKRKQWLEMLKDGGEGKFDILIAKSYSRFGRNQEETLKAIKDLREKDIRIILLEDNLDSETDIAKFGLFGWLAEQEAQKTSERIKMVWESYNEQGKMHSCRPPYGYDYDKNEKNIVVNELEKEVVRRVFDLFLKGQGCKTIANILMNEGIYTKRGGNWESNTISNMLKNEVYIGTLVQGKTQTIDVTRNKTKKYDKSDWYRKYNNHEAIIESDIFDKVQIEIEKRSQKAKSTYVRHSNKYLFSNLLFCGECGSAMTGKLKKSLKYKVKYFCNNYEKNGTKVGHRSIAIYEDVLLQYLKYKLDEAVEENYQSLKDKLEEKSDVVELLKKDLKNVEKQLNDNIKRANKLLDLLVDSTIDRSQYTEQNKFIGKEIESLGKRKDDIIKKIEKNYNNQNEVEMLKSGITGLLNTELKDWNNAMIKEVVNRMIVYEDNTVEVEYKYLFYK
ncbi:recombinase family protein [Clostridium sp. C2-6-12]|uniref:recombinase family protein n=1 Tax=Clostridium sp. C2-6-12 TaxID=2698832 RepID=UPI001371941B|nr:recombinase family protein [Clostridium sp. C2-6-12]